MRLFSELISRSWYRKDILSLALLPLSVLYWAIIGVRKVLYQFGILPQYEIGIPVVVVGNLTTGGTGKTPLVVKLVEILIEEGFSPGIVSRGYKSQLRNFPYLVDGTEATTLVGDEALLLYERTGRPVIIDPNRVRGSRDLRERCKVDIVVSDDGLQHVQLCRSIEVIVIDGTRRFGNNYLLPAGPLREPKKRLTNGDFVVANGGVALTGEYQMNCRLQRAIRLHDGEQCDLSDFSNKTVHAIAGIANPDSFFLALSHVGIHAETHWFPDHHHYAPEELKSLRSSIVLMTSKDAVKCRGFAGPDWWDVPISVELENNFKGDFIAALMKKSFKADEAHV